MASNRWLLPTLIPGYDGRTSPTCHRSNHEQHPRKDRLADSISPADTAKAIEAFRQVALKPDAIAHAIAHAINQPADVDTTDIVVRPLASAA